MTAMEELERELESLQNNGLIEYYRIQCANFDGSAFSVEIGMHEKRNDTKVAQ